MKFSVKIKISSILALSLLIIYMLKPVEAQAPGGNTYQVPPQKDPQAATSTQSLTQNFAPGTPVSISTVSQGAVIGLLSSATCLLGGVDPLQAEGKCIGVDPKTGQLAYAEQNGGLAGTMATLIGGTMNIPVSSGQYGQYLASNFGVLQTAYAQTGANGLGFDRLSPLIGIWTRFRDIAYLFFVLAFTVIGFAIILRVKIDARTVMTIQNQIPKIVIALVLVTFSYAIAGFMIDIMYVLMFLVILTFTNLIPTNFNPNANVFSVFNSSFSPGYHLPGIIGLTGEVSFGISKVLTGLATDFIESTISSFFKVFFTPFSAIKAIGCGAIDIFSTGGLAAIGYIPKVGDWLQGIPKIGGLFGGSAACDFVENFFYVAVLSLFTVITFIIVLIAILFSLFRIWFTLVKSFVYVLIDSMIGPLWIAAGIFPGSKLNFSTWVRHLAGHLSVFPMCFAVILLGKTMMDAVSHSGGLFSPPLVGDVIGGNTTVAAFVGFGFILSMPTILERTRTALGAISFGLKDIQTSILTGVGIPKSAYGEYGKMRKETRTFEPTETAGVYRRPGWGEVIRRRLPF